MKLLTVEQKTIGLGIVFLVASIFVMSALVIYVSVFAMIAYGVISITALLGLALYFIVTCAQHSKKEVH